MNNNIRTRFAPSPTGFLHVGGLRTALYNYLFAKQHNGAMVLRIEDTDQTRFIEGATENLIKTLKGMDIEYNEGPDKEGPYGPYIQSKRIAIYRNHANQLIEQGDAYYCFCTPEHLEKMRKKQEALKQQSKYDGTCRKYSSTEVQKKLDSGLPYVIRLKMPQEGNTTFKDLIRGEVSVQNELMDDQILIKSDGYPTYHLANVIDDYLMHITHVIRGEEWLLSVPKHLRLYEAFQWEIPQMAHLPLLLNPDRSKLSKRQGDVAVEDFLSKGYLPEALNNFVALLGWNPGDNQEFFTIEELIHKFSLERVSKSGAIFDFQKLKWMNSHYIKQLPQGERIKYFNNFLKKSGYDVSDSEKTQKIIEAIYKRVSNGEEILDQVKIFYNNTLHISEDNAKAILKKSTSEIVLNTFLEKANSYSEIDLLIFKNIMKEIQNQSGIEKEKLWMPLRVALTGVTHGPELPAVIEIFGKQKIQNFINQALKIRGTL